MSNSAEPTGDVLNDLGQWFLSQVDTRWIIVGAIIFVSAFCLVLRLIKKRVPSRDDAITIGNAVLTLYGALVLFCLLVLSDPPVFLPEKKLLYQSAGFIASLFLFIGVFAQVKKVWTVDDTDGANKQVSESAGAQQAVAADRPKTGSG